MWILIVTAGSRGDVAPFTGLGQRLQQSGHQVALAAHARFADLVRECGLEYRALPGGPVELVRARTAAPAPAAAPAVFAAFLDELGEGVMTAVAAGTDLLLTAFGPAPLSRLRLNTARLSPANVPDWAMHSTIPSQVSTVCVVGDRPIGHQRVTGVSGPWRHLVGVGRCS